MWFLSPCVALAGSVVVAASVPVEVHQGPLILAQLYVEGTVSLPLAEGEQRLTLFVDGNPHDITVVVPKDGSTTVVVAKNGITTDGSVSQAVAVGPVEFRVAGKTEVMITLDDRRLRLGPGDVLKVELTDGDHAISVRDGSGTVVWAKGQLAVHSPRGVIVQFAEGRLPDVAGTGGRFVPDGT